jgi:hypothetical protein
MYVHQFTCLKTCVKQIVSTVNQKHQDEPDNLLCDTEVHGVENIELDVC